MSLGRFGKFQRYGFAVGLISFFGIVLMASISLLRFREHLGWVAHTYKVIDLIQDADANVESAEAGARGYLVTHDSRTLDSFNRGQEAVASLLEELIWEVRDNPLQQANAQKWSAEIKNRFDFMQDLMQSAGASRTSDLHLASLKEIRDLADRMRREEQLLFKVRNQDAVFAAEFSIAIIGAGALLAFAALLLGRRSLKKAIHNFRNQSLLLQSIFDSIGDGLMVVDQNGKVTHCNQAGTDLLGVKVLGENERSHVHVSAVINPTTGLPLTLEESPLSRSLRNGEVINGFETVTTRTAGDSRTLSTDSRPVHDSNGGIIGALALFKDVTQRKATEREYINAREDAIKASKLKSEFLANISHEIRTPMNGVMGMTTLLLNTRLNEEQLEYVNIIKSSASSLLTLINEILDHAKIEQGKMELDVADFNLPECIESVVTVFRHLTRSKSIELKFSFDDSLPEFVKGDALRLKQVLTNLVGNAFKFTEQGFISLSVAQGEEEGNVDFEVRDTGRGIPKPVLGRLFQEFSQAGIEIQRKFGGSGLGLMISQKIVRLMGGRIEVESAERLGARFFFTVRLPAANVSLVTPFSQKRTGAHEHFHGHVLVAEDHVVNQKIAKTFLELLGVECEIVSNGQAAFEAVQRTRFDLVFMDCRMEPMDGYKATELIRAWENKAGRSRIQIVAVTAEGMSGDRQRCTQVGMDDFLSKPIEIEDLKRVLRARLNPMVEMREFNRSTLEKLASYDGASGTLAEELIEEYHLSAPKIFEQLRHAYLRKDFDAARDHAHTLKSISQTLGLEALGGLCEEVEAGSSDAETMDALETALRRALDWTNANRSVRTGKVS